MKKVILALMIMVSVSFATPPQYVTYNGVIYKLNRTSLGFLSGVKRLASCPTPQYFVQTASDANSVTYTDIAVGCIRDTSYTSNPYYTLNNSYLYTKATDCPAPNIVQDGECVKAVDTNNSNCDNITKYTDITTGKCVDCMQFSGFTSRASCACDAKGTTYTPGHSSGVVTWSTHSTMSYKRQKAMCDNGQEIYIYYDPIDITPDTNTSTPTDSNGTKPPDTNTTTNTPDVNGSTVTTPTQADVVNALKSIQDGQKDSNTALKELGVDLKSVNTSLKEQGFTFDSILAKIVDGNAKADARYALMDTEYKGNTQYRNMMGKWVDANLLNATAQLGATNAVKTAVDGTTGAVNAQGTNITNKLDDVIKAIKDNNGTGTKDGNGTDLSKVEDKLDTLHKDNNSSQSKLDTLHDDANTTNITLKDIKNLLDFNGSKYSLDDLMPSGGEGWFTSHRLDLSFNNYGGDCYCQTAEFSVAGHQFIFPPQESLDVIPFTTISNIFMAFIYVLGLKAFIKS